MRRTLVPLLLAVAALAAAATSGRSANGAASSPATFLLTGGGWGHGVGMSQWGAYGQAKAGRDYRTILQTYYTGVDFGTVPVGTPKSLRVLVGDGVAKAQLASTQPWRVRDATGTTYPLAAGSLVVTPDLELPVGDAGAAEPLVGPLVFLPAPGSTLSFGGRSYRANLRVSVVGKGLQVVNVVPLETYLLGVVPGEMPSGWPLDALEAQAVAARTYAITSLVKGKSFDLYSDWRSQMYYGVPAEKPSTTQAVKSTRGEILTYAGKPIQALYFSSSGGRTANALDVYGTDVPYLVSVDDPWDESSPLHAWQPKTYTGATLAKALKLSSPVVDAVSVPGAVGAPAVVRFTMASGATQDVRITDVRTRLTLRSSSFRLGTLRLVRPDPVAPGTRATLTGVARDVDDPVLQKLSASGAWVAGPPLQVADDGTLTARLKVAVPTRVRLVADGVVGPAVPVAVTGIAQ